MDDLVAAEAQQLPVVTPSAGDWRRGAKVSGNPKGRPRSGLALADQLRKAVAPELPRLLQVLVREADRGNMLAHKILWDRVWPSLKPIEQPMPLSLPDAGSLTDLRTAVIGALARGQVSFSQAADLLQAVASTGRLLEVEQDEAAIKQMEADRAELQRLKDDETAKLAALQAELRNAN